MERGNGDNSGERQAARGGTAPLTEGMHARSNLSLPGDRAASTPAGASATPGAPGISLQQGVSRARNIAHAVVMIVGLLLRYLLVKVVGAQISRIHSRTVIIVGRLCYVAWKILGPHVARLQAKAAATSNKAFRMVLVALITMVVPLEKVASLALKGAKVHGARLAAQSARATVQVLRPLLAGLTQVIQAGFQLAVVRKVLARLIQILEEAQR